MKRFSEVCFILLFVGFLCAVPLLILLHGSKIQALYYENRALSAPPELNTQALLSGDYFSRWDGWLTDHVAGRERLLKLNTWLDYRLLDRPAVMVASASSFLPKTGLSFASDSTVESARRPTAPGTWTTWPGTPPPSATTWRR